MKNSPWWYRQRAIVIGVLYAVGFWVGGYASSSYNRQYVPEFVAMGRAWGDRGVTVAMLVCVLLMVACIAFRVWGASYLRAAVVWNPGALDNALLTDGPFRFTRNPLYFGNVLMALGLGALASPVGWLFINIANLVFLTMLIHHEERGMRDRYGAQFESYCARVPRLVPHVVPAPCATHARPSLRDGLLSEIFMMSLLVGMLAALAAPAYAFYTFPAIYVAGITMHRVVMRVPSTPKPKGQT